MHSDCCNYPSHLRGHSVSISEMGIFGQMTGWPRPSETESGKTSFSSGRVMRKNENMPQEKYARIERERRFLLAQFPSSATVVRDRRITDNYIEGTTLRLRKQCYSDGLTTFKLTQK